MNKILITLAVAVLSLPGCAFKSYDTSISSSSVSSKHSPSGNSIKYGNGDVYTGPMSKGKPHGKGVLKFATGDVYEGQFVNGIMQGQGKYHIKNVATYTGPMNQDKFTASGVLTYRNGIIYSGTYSDARKPIKGVMKYKDGKRRIGGFKGLLLSGQAEEIHSNGLRYKGGFEKGQKHGEGVLTTATGDYFQVWKNGKLSYESAGPKTRDLYTRIKKCGLWLQKSWLFTEGGCEQGMAGGEATITSSDGRIKIDGIFKGGSLIRGQKIDAKKGLTYDGEWKNFTYHGYGTKFDATGVVQYQGQFANGIYHGKGYCPYNNQMEPCEWRQGKRVDSVYVMRIERERIQKWQTTCNAAQNNLTSYANDLSNAANNTCQKEYADIQHSVDYAFSDEDTMYYLQNGRGGWIEASVDEARSCRKRVSNAVNNYSNAMQRAESTIRSNNCPAANQLRSFQQLRQAVQSDIRQRDSQMSGMESDYIRMEKRAQSAAQSRLSRERAEMWTDALNQFKSNLNNISREMNQIQSQTNRLVSQAYKESSRRKQERQRLQQQTYNASVQRFKTGYALQQKNKLADINRKIAAQNTAIDNRIASERTRCINGGGTWNSAGNSCNRVHQINIQGWGATTNAQGKPMTAYGGASSAPGSYSGSNSSASSSGSGTRSAYSEGAGKISSTSKSAANKKSMPPRLIPVFVQNLENSSPWSSEDAACKYAIAAAKRRADAKCKKEFNGRRAYKSEIGIPVDANCHSCREIKTGWSNENTEYKCQSNVTMQCKLPNRQNITSDNLSAGSDFLMDGKEDMKP